MTLGWNLDGTLASSSAAGGTSYSWDVLDHLTQVSSPAGMSKMAYWPGGQRALLQDATGTQVYVGGVSERHKSPTGVFSATRSYSIGGTMVAVRNKTTGGPVSITALFGDRSGSITLGYTSSVAGGSQAEWYEPYGTRRAGGIEATHRGWIGQHTDTTSGLNYLNNRYYDPSIGVFLSVDPLVAKTGQPYLYAGGNPTTLTDPNGLCSVYSPTSGIIDDGNGKCASSNTGQGGSHGSAGGGGITGADPRQWCHVGVGGPAAGNCGAPPLTGEYRNPSQVSAVLDYLSQFGGSAADGAAGATEGATVSVAGYVTARGTTVLAYTRYRAGLADFGNGIAPAGKLLVGTRWIGRAFVALQAGVTAFESWHATEGHTTIYRLSYSAVKTVVTTGGAVAGADAGAGWGATGGAAIGGPPGAVVGGLLGGVAGGLFGWWATDKVTDLVWKFTYEQVSG